MSDEFSNEQLASAIAIVSSRDRLQQPKRDGYRNLQALGERLAQLAEATFTDGFNFPRHLMNELTGQDS